jgi:hypothetical protein
MLQTTAGRSKWRVTLPHRFAASLGFIEMLSIMRSAVLRPATSLTGSLALHPAASGQSSSLAPLNSLLPFVRFATKKAAGSSKNGQ